MVNTTTRRFHRSLNDAFPDERAIAIWGYRRSWWHRNHRITGVILLIAGAIATVFLFIKDY